MKTTTLKALALAMLLTLGLVMPMAAQSDGFFRSNNDNYVNRAEEGLSNETFGVNGTGGMPVPTQINLPLGNGLLIMMAAGAGYALSRRRRARKGMTLLLAAAMLLGMTQCKKKVETLSSVDTDKVFITLDLVNNSKHDVVIGESSATVEYTTGDKIHVGCDGKYVGTLTHDGTYFSGNIANPKEGEYLYFYFVSGLLDETKMSSSTTTYNVSISDQSTQLPVLSCGVSTNPYETGVTSYTSLLRNKVALMKFEIQPEYVSEDIRIFGMQAEAMIDFANNTITPTGKTDVIKLNNPSGSSGEYRWGVLLPQEITNGYKGLAKAGETYCQYAFWNLMHGIQANGFYTESQVTAWWTSKGFTVSSNGNAVVFSSGNLQYKEGTGWRFAPNQTDYIGAWDPTDWVDLFGWGTWTGSNPTPLKTISLYTEPYNWDDNDFVEKINDYKWRTLSDDEWRTLLTSRPYEKRFINALVGTNTKGLIIFPDGYTGANVGAYTYNDMNSRVEVTSADFNTMLADGAVFLPQAGRRGYTSQYITTISIDPMVAYWSSTPGGDFASYVYADDNGLSFMSVQNHYGCSVRLVR